MSETFPSFKQGGALWFTDLSIADPTYMMPILASAGFLVTIELGGEAGEQKDQTAQMKNIFRILGLAMIPLTASIQQSVFVYWITSNGISIFQTLLFKIPAVQQALNLKPEIPGAKFTTIAGLPQAPVAGNTLQFIPKDKLDQLVANGNNKAVEEARLRASEASSSSANRRRLREMRQAQEQQQEQQSEASKKA